MALQELDLDIHYCLRKTNAQADALSRYPVPIVSKDCANSQTPALITAVEAPLSPGQRGEPVPETTALGE